MKISEAASLDLRLTEPEMIGMIPGPEEFSSWKKDKMGQVETTGCCFVHGGVTPGKQGISREFQVMFLDTDSRCDDSRTHRGTGDQLSTSSPTSLRPGFPLSLFHSLKNAPSLCRVIIWRGLMFYAERGKALQTSLWSELLLWLHLFAKHNDGVMRSNAFMTFLP